MPTSSPVPMNRNARPLRCLAWLLFVLAAGGWGSAQEEIPPPPQCVAILGPVADGTAPQPAPPPALPEFRVKGVTTHRLADRTVTMVRVWDPGLSEPPAPPMPPTLEQIDAFRATSAWREASVRQARTRILLVSATVHDRRRTLVRWHGSKPGAGSFAAWSNIDFNHFGGMGGFEAQGIRYSLLMSVGNQDDAKFSARAGAAGRTYQGPRIPDLPDDAPTFVLTDGDASDEEGIAPMRALHELYNAEGARLAAACAARELAAARRAADLKANPPAAKDAVIYFWPGRGSRCREPVGEGGE